MKPFVILTFSSLLLLGAGCSSKPAHTNAQANQNQNTNSNTQAATGTDVAATSTPSNANTNTAVKNTNTATKKVTAPPTRTSFLVEADDSGFSPSSGTAIKGSMVTVTFKVRTSNVIYNGLTIRSNKYDLGNIKGGTSKSVTFPADSNITFSAFWSTGAYRGAWTLYVK